MRKQKGVGGLCVSGGAAGMKERGKEGASSAPDTLSATHQSDPRVMHNGGLQFTAACHVTQIA